ncbi:MAG TPA: efflux RND transporter periplasmic adaptor subunit [Bryobacteraceae bacterium]|nr:efflux RND transporter periplasmic adaptor subunit [Bryobacteraceae bacterium]
MKKILVVVLIAGAAVAAWFFLKRQDVPQVAFLKPARETISNTLSTNGKVEPVEYQEVRVESPGLVKRVTVHAGDAVRTGQVIAEISEPGLQQELDAATAREAQARSDLQTLQSGGRSSDTSELDATRSRLQSDRDAAQRNLDALERLLAKQAATPYEVEQARQAVKSLDVQIASLQQRRAALVGKGDITGAEARVREAEANVRLARDRIALDVIRAPISGTLYDLPARAGSFLNAGEPVASIGRLDPVRVRVYVDEPELGRVAAGQSVRITWDALPGREWTGTVEKRPTEVIALGTRQVGEVLCTIGNPQRELVPGTNVNAIILTQVVPNALTIPKAAVRRNGTVGVFVLGPDSTLKWRQISTGASDALRVEVVNGLGDGEAVAAPSEITLKDGAKVTPVSQ